ncbi:MAG TPA: 4Fe-4S dicluster domain-containing protein [Verrucomicrobiota bacterium]|nr:4Fe-4S dicluster domain-containing protein [Verrucomicrobiota bacterium]HNU49994.1 4Fe-4S dicluster domain-containing protein [Verrucomicrobiota bacterium]
MSVLSKCREALLCLRAGRVTLPYPAQPRPTPPRFRGRPIFNAAKCIGCAGCANNCPAREILVVDLCQEIRVIQYLGRRCTFCGRCAEVCPEKAITMSRDFETATPQIRDLRQRLDLFMSTCQRCGRCFQAPSPLEQLKLKGYRFDDVEHERWIFRSKAFLDSDATVDDIPIELD